MSMTKELSESSALYVVATPLGNLNDLSARAIDTLRRVAWVAAEDTRHSAHLLRHIGSTARLFSAHTHNEEAAAQQTIGYLHQGESVALITDAGTPAISDPGSRLVARVRAAGFRVVPIPGPCAAIAALSVAGIRAEQVLFYGFLPAKHTQRQEIVQSLATLPYALIFYEAPHRIVDCINDLSTFLDPEGQRTVVIARELSKCFETVHACPLSAASSWLQADANQQRGEFVLVIDAPVVLDSACIHQAESERVLRVLLADGLPVKQVAKLTHAITGMSKNALYARALALRESESTN